MSRLLNIRRYAESRVTAFVWILSSTRVCGGMAPRMTVAACLISSGPASNGSPPCRTTVISASPWAAACSAMRRAAWSRTVRDILSGWCRQLWSAISYM